MFYRYEAKKNGVWYGIFHFFNPDQRRYVNRYFREPKWYKNHPGIDSKCWFTEKGYEKYHAIIDAMIMECGNLEIRILEKSTIDHPVCKGRIQWIEVGG